MACKESWIEKNYYSPIRTFVPKPKQIISEPKRYISQPTTYSSQTKTNTSSHSYRYYHSILKKMSQIVAKNILLANIFVVIFVHAFVYLLSLVLYISYRYNLKDDRMIKYIYKRCLN